MCSLLTLWEVGHVFLCASVMLTCHFRPFCCLPLNTVQCNNTVLIGLEQHIRLLWCLKICKHITIFCSTYQQKHEKKNLTFFFPKKQENSIKPNETKSITLHLFEDDWQKNMNMFSVSFGTSFITNECENWS